MGANVLTDRDFDILFREAHTANGWLDKPVGDETLQKIYDIMKLGATSANCCPARIVFVKTPEAKARLKPLLDAGNVEKTMAAPVTAIFGYDMEFYEHMGFLFPHTDAKAWYVGKPKLIEDTAFRNGTLQAAYFMLAARAFGLDCGPMSGFDNARVDAEFFPGGKVRSNFLCNLGHADPAKNHPRGPKFGFDEVCKIV